MPIVNKDIYKFNNKRMSIIIGDEILLETSFLQCCLRVFEVFEVTRAVREEESLPASEIP